MKTKWRPSGLIILGLCLVALIFAGCQGNNASKSSSTATSKNGEVEKEEKAASKASKAKTAPWSAFEEADEAEVQAILRGRDEKTKLVDTRPQENFSGWALEGAKQGGHLKNAKLFSARWLDCDLQNPEVEREAYLKRAIETQNLSKEQSLIFYDYTGETAPQVAGYFKNKGYEQIKIFRANKLIDEGDNVQAYAQHKMFLPPEIVKEISDVKKGLRIALSPEAQEITGGNIEDVILVDVGFGNVHESSYFKTGHVPGAMHMNSDLYERPRVYVPEKRSAYAKEWRLISLEEFRDEVCTQYGITQNSKVILTGTEGPPQARLGFMLRSLGVEVYAMTGNLIAWQYNDYPLDTDEDSLVEPKPVAAFGSASILKADEIIWTEEMKQILHGEKSGQIVDNRRKAEREGKSTGYPYHDLAGYIEGTLWAPYDDEKEGLYFEHVDQTPRTREEIESIFAKHDIEPNLLTAFFCGDSWAAARIAYICQANDLTQVKQWGRGWIPWSNTGETFTDHQGRKVHYDKHRDTLLAENGKDVSDGVNQLADQDEK